MIKKVNIIGSGKVATHLALHLSNYVEISQIWSRNILHANQLAERVKSKGIDSLSVLDHEADLNIIAVTDEALSEIADQLPHECPVVHTSGSIGIEVFEKFDNAGILYPLQTFSANRAVNFKEVPFLIESNSGTFESEIIRFCSNYFSSNIVKADSFKRAQIHLAAVITNNFYTQLLAEAKHILDDQEVDYHILEPLLKETISKSFMMNPTDALTGPAKRKDRQVLLQQMEKIKDPKVKQVYRLMSEIIMGEDLNA